MVPSIQDLYKNSDFSKLPNKGGDKTPIELDGGKDLRKESNLEKVQEVVKLTSKNILIL